MIHYLHINNFRSIRSQEIGLSPITVIYGPNGTGKSSLLYSLFVLRNIVLNPNQTPVAFFNLNFTNLGDFEKVVFDHRKEEQIKLVIGMVKDSSILGYTVSFGEKEGRFELVAEDELKARLSLTASFPYPANQQDRRTLEVGGKFFEVIWNGFTAQVNPQEQTPENLEKAREIAIILNSPIEAIRKIDFVPLRRGFSQPHYSPTSVFTAFMSEGEVATLLANNVYLQGKLSTYFEQITNREFRVHVPPGTGIFSLVTVEKPLGITIELVNDGFGMNQLVYLLAKSLPKDVNLVCIEEPEIHLHPTSLRKLARTLVQIAKNEGKQFLISTHSEPFLLALLSLVAKGELKPQEELSCYLAVKEGKETRFELQEVQEDGQVKGGLSSFMEGELEDIKAFLKIKE